MKLRVCRTEDRRYETTATRSDGLTMTLSGQGFAHRLPRHLAHFAVEETLELRHGLLGSIAAGALPPGARITGQLPPGAIEKSAAITESTAQLVGETRALVAAFDEIIDQRVDDRRPQVDPSPQSLSMHRGARVVPLTKTDVSRVVTMWRDLQTRWDQVPVGGALELEWKTPLMSGGWPALKRSIVDSIRDQFPIARTKAYLNNASVHPISLATHRAATQYLDRRLDGPRWGEQYSSTPEEVKASFAALVNAKPSEISFVTSTEVGENLVVNGLGLPAATGNIVTDALHFAGSLYMYRSLQRQGLDVRVAMPREGRIDMEDLAALVDRNTKLVAVSMVSFVNGFQHDLQAVAGLAHAHGAHVYADIIQAAGCVPVDLRASQVDFAATATYKWLMGDFGLGFFYAREDLQGTAIRRTMYGSEQLSAFDYHIFPHQSRASEPFTWTVQRGAGGDVRGRDDWLPRNGCGRALTRMDSATRRRQHPCTPPRARATTAT